jgi:hypothetical protein
MRHFNNNEYKTKNRKTCTCLTVPIIYIVDLTGIVHSADEIVGGSWYKLPGPNGPERGPEPYCVAYVVVFVGSIIIRRLYKLTP